MEKNKIVTVEFGSNNSSNTFLVDSEDGEHVLLYHPLSPTLLIRKLKSDLDLVSPNIKDSTERCLDLAKRYNAQLSHTDFCDLEAICMFFVAKRFLTPKQKNTLATICGSIASSEFKDDINQAMNFITNNSNSLDDFNQMWYHNFRGLFSKNQPITSKKQITSIFNIAGFLLAQIGNPRVSQVV